jgi:peptidoglycan/LPS O-acetylase OafA/YrhL
VAGRRGLGDLGDLGVRVFFVISGFLITTLLREAQATGISIKASTSGAR